MMKNSNLNIKPLSSWGIGYNQRPLVIAGPCSAESEEQMLTISKALSANGINILRAGVWKPRTRPNSFEGVGSEALPWFKRVKVETGMLTSTEVATGKHVAEALAAGVDILWIGARTSANPFAIQEIADALKGVDIPVFVKNPINPDVELWIGAIERLNRVGISRVGAIHRGFSSYEHSIYRNVPQWQIPIELKQRLPQIPLLCDPSHIAGNRELLEELSQKALDLNFDGLMIEAHPDPDSAWSDAQQQITADHLDRLLGNLHIRQIKPAGISLNTLEDLRFKIDKIDVEIIDLLAQRMITSEDIGHYKAENNMTILQSSRWEQILRKSLDIGREHKLSDEFVAAFFKAVHQESINKQTSILNTRRSEDV